MDSWRNPWAADPGGSRAFEQLHRLELPVIIQTQGHFALLAEVKGGTVMLADPERGWHTMPFEHARADWGDEVQVVLAKRLADTPIRQFGWGWFTPVLKRFQWPLIQVLLASLFIQLFQLANPLLLQQIIDKVINQSNLSALQVLGAALVVAALFQGLLTAVRTWLLIDTTDRMDLLLGSQVIDKLLRLPLRFFEKRPVGELSQRLSELGNLRGFLTGTAITSALDLLFATIYILIMLVYSPLLTAVALGTVPLYVLLILFIAPVYRRLIRHQAQYAARTQSHLIETLGGIQTVKAQHFELNSRWRWQERYSGQIAESFKSVVLGSSASEVGNFLNQLSSLLIIWVGVYQVVNGELSLPTHRFQDHRRLCDRTDPSLVRPLARLPASGNLHGAFGRHRRSGARSGRTGCRSDLIATHPWSRGVRHGGLPVRDPGAVADRWRVAKHSSGQLYRHRGPAEAAKTR